MTLKAAPVNCREDRGIEENDINSRSKVYDDMTRGSSDEIIDRIFDQQQQADERKTHDHAQDFPGGSAVCRKPYIAYFKKSADKESE